MITQAYLKTSRGYNTASLRDSLTQAERVIIFQAKPVRSLEEDPILKRRRREPLPSEKKSGNKTLLKNLPGGFNLASRPKSNTEPAKKSPITQK